MNVFKLLLSKPKIAVLLILTGVVAYFIPNFGDISILKLLLFVIAGTLSADGSLIINYFIDRDIDHLMERTKNRASVGKNAIKSSTILGFGTLVTIIGIAIGYFTFGFWTAFHLAWGAFFYIFGYSLILKRKSIFNTVIGGLASPAPVWAGYAARYEELNLRGDFLGIPLEGWLLGGLVFIWTPSHTWALSAKNVDDYRAAGIPMVPVKFGLEKTGEWTFYWGLSVIAYGILISYWMTNSILFTFLIASVSIYLFYGLWIFKMDANIHTAKKCFLIHNNWLAIVFISILLARWII